MKKAIKLSAIIALLFATNGVMGAEPKVTVDEVRKNIIIELDNPTYSYQIRFIDMASHVFFSEKFDKNEMRNKRLDLTKLPIGDYFLKVENDLQTKTFKILVNNMGVHMISEETEYKPVFRKNDGSVFLNLFNPELTPINIEVRDTSDRLLFSQTIEGTLTVSKSFNFNDAFVDSYSIKVKKGSNEFTEVVNVK